MRFRLSLIALFHFPGFVRLTPNIAFRRKATQSSTYRSRSNNPGMYVASNAVDGDVFGSCSLTDGSRPNWWQVDLLQVYEVTKVAITAGPRGFGMLSPILLFACSVN